VWSGPCKTSHTSRGYGFKYGTNGDI